MLFRNYVTVRITDGLGNQMFQYASGLGLARRLRASLHCDTTSYLTPHKRRLQLPAFGLELSDPPAPGLPDRLRLRGAPRVLLDHAEYIPEMLTIRAPVRLEGWFQNWRYFSPVTAELRAAFDPGRLKLSPAAEDTLRRINAAPLPVAVHVRWGDYRDEPSAFPLLGRDHYERAREAIEAIVGVPSYFVFADEPEVAAAFVEGWPNVTLVRGHGATEDFRLMASCRHFLIANSTFSWWAAWLGRSPDKRVIAPKVWFGEGFSRKVDVDQRLPPEWIRV